MLSLLQWILYSQLHRQVPTYTKSRRVAALTCRPVNLGPSSERPRTSELSTADCPFSLLRLRISLASTFCSWKRRDEEELSKDREGDCQPLYREGYFLLIKFLDMQFAFSNVLVFHQFFFFFPPCIVANHKWLLSGTITGGAVLVPTHPNTALYL